jgi:hypothetical protein
MDRPAANLVTKAFLANIQKDLADAAGIAQAATVCAEGGNIPAAIKIAMDIEDPAYRADRMLKAVLLIRHELLGDGPD